ncbi:Snf7 family [Protomyces lactucae-debilis]|uniref:Snf7 family n=1 Tax=Protomyces lactucae-debilis TaxID=2754530 RepID=A0A1Y2ETG2_PROLT|nr:Snf7 family [Protomyces lactucae-debilis]ORY74850.1 Snf7 family [Protomyces lactucae-debilis]
MGQSSSRAVTSQDRAILDMKVQRDKLRQYQRRIQTVLDRELAIAKTCLAKGQKEKAMLALRQRKYQEGLLEKTDQQLATLEQLTSSIEFALVEKDVLYGLQQGNQVLRAINKEMSIERVEKLMDETADAVAYQQVRLTLHGLCYRD